MTPTELVYNEVLKGCLEGGVDINTAKDAAVMTLQKYKNNQFTKVSALIKTSISDAKKINKKKKR